MFNEMYRFDNLDDEQARRLAEDQRTFRQSAAIARYAHSRTGLMLRHLRRLADALDPAGRARASR